MCVYCTLPDWGNRWVPFPNTPPYVPSPIDPCPYTTSPAPRPTIWSREMLVAFEDICEGVRKLEEAAGGGRCREADPSKMNFFREIREKLDEMEREETKPPFPNTPEEGDDLSAKTKTTSTTAPARVGFHWEKSGYGRNDGGSVGSLKGLSIGSSAGLSEEYNPSWTLKRTEPLVLHPSDCGCPQHAPFLEREIA